MKFSYKVFLTTILLVVVAMSVSGAYIINSIFDSSLKREVELAMEENSIIRFAFETITYNAPVKYESTEDNTIKGLASSLETNRFIRVKNEKKENIYSGINFEFSDKDLDKLDDDNMIEELKYIDGSYYTYIASTVKASERMLYVETLKDVSYIFQDRAENFNIYRAATIVTIILTSILVLLITKWLTKPIEELENATKAMAEGDYSIRAKKLSSDELGELSLNFNLMADYLEKNIKKLEEEAEAKDYFVAAFSHELKTPLTAIIGYADLLRTHKLNEEDMLMSVDYIYKEGKRLEDLSLKLLEIVVLKNRFLKLNTIKTETIFEYIENSFKPNKNIDLLIKYEDAKVLTDLSLLSSVLINLIDNAIKASDENAVVELKGKIVENDYEFSVKDNGRGILKEDLSKISEAFYKVDKSRTDRRNVGLGLTLSSEILKLFNSSIKFKSKVGQGTTVSFLLEREVKENEN